MTTAQRHLRVVPDSSQEPTTVTISAARYVQLRTIEVLAAEAVAKTQQHRQRAWKSVAVGLTDALAAVVDGDLVRQFLPDGRTWTRNNAPTARKKESEGGGVVVHGAVGGAAPGDQVMAACSSSESCTEPADIPPLSTSVPACRGVPGT